MDGGRKKMQINDIKKKKTMIFGQRDRGSLGDPALTRIPDRALAHFWIPVESNSKKNPGDPKNVRPCRCRLFLFLRMISLLCFFFHYNQRIFRWRFRGICHPRGIRQPRQDGGRNSALTDKVFFDNSTGRAIASFSHLVIFFFVCLFFFLFAVADE